MPTRLIRDGILTSDRVDMLTEAEEVFYRRLHSIVDDYGVCDARPAILLSSLYPLRLRTKTEEDVIRHSFACERAGLVLVYNINGKPYLQVLDFRQTQRSKPKCPLPSEADCVASANRRKQMLADVHLDVFVFVCVFGGGFGFSSSLRSDEVLPRSLRSAGAENPPALVVAEQGQPPLPDRPKRARAKKNPKDSGTLSGPTWLSYSTAYVDRYKVDPVRNAKVNALLCKFVERVGAEEAPLIAAWFVGHNASWYVTKGHSIEALLADAEKLRTEWATGRQTTQTQARMQDETATRGNVFRDLMNEMYPEDGNDGRIEGHTYDHDPDQPGGHPGID